MKVINLNGKTFFMMRKIKFLFMYFIAFSMHTLHPLPQSSLRGFDAFIINFKIHPLVGSSFGQNVIENILRHGKEKTIVETGKALFHQNSIYDPILPTKIGFFGKMQLYHLGWFSALIHQERKELKKQITDIYNSNKKQHKKVNLNPIRTFSQSCKEESLVIARELERLLNIADSAKKTKSKSKHEKTTITLYDPELSLFLLNALAVSKAQTKKDYLEFLKGFYEHCSLEQKKWFAPSIDFNKIATNEWERLCFTENDYKDLCANTFKNPSKEDLLYVCAQQNDDIHWTHISFTRMLENSQKEEIQIGDCIEAAGVWAPLQLVLSPTINTQFDLSLLPSTLQSKKYITEFVTRFTERDINDLVLRREQFFVLSDPEFKKGRGKIIYHSPHFYALACSIQNIRHALNYLFEIDAKDFTELGDQLSSSAQKVSFLVDEKSLKNDLGKVIVEVKDLKNNNSRSITIFMNELHAILIIKRAALNKPVKLNPKELLKNHNIDPKSFPFSVYIRSKKKGQFNLYRPLAGKNLNSILRIWQKKDAESTLLQKEILNLIDFEKIPFNCNGADSDFDKDVIVTLIQNTTTSPFKELINKKDPTEFINMIEYRTRDEKNLSLFYNNVDSNWPGFKKNNILLDALDHICKRYPSNIKNFLEKHNFNQKEAAFIKEIWWKLLYNNKNFINFLIQNPNHSFIKILLLSIPLDEVAQHIYIETNNVEHLSKFLLAQKTNLKNDTIFIKNLENKLNFKFKDTLNPSSKINDSNSINQKQFDQIMNFTSIALEACSWIPSLSNYALALRLGSLLCQKNKLIQTDSIEEQSFFKALSFWQTFQIGTQLLKKLQK